jgi:uncharacterized damage-inducible protein DinB
MEVTEACQVVLDQVGDAIEQINDDHFVQPVKTFNGSTIGQHFRHTLEFFQCLMAGYNPGVVSYDKRDHDTNIEQDRDLALEIVRRAKSFIKKCDLNRAIELEVSYDPDSSEEVIVSSNMSREITYNIEHAIHHMALIKIGIMEICPYVKLPDGFGIAVSTLKYRKQQSI